VGGAGGELHGLDPHTTQPTPLVEDEDYPSLEYLASLSCPRAQKMRVSRLDPSLALGFYFRTREEFGQWRARIDELSKDGEPMPFRVEVTTPEQEDDLDPSEITFEDDCGADDVSAKGAADEDDFLLV